jgi:diguanylate cyclase (GGDEF)-like protein
MGPMGQPIDSESIPVPRRKQGLRLGLQAQFLLLASACVLPPLLAAQKYLLDQNERVLGEKAREGLTSAVSRKGLELDEWLRQRLQEAHSWSLSFVVYEGVDAALGGTARAPRARQELTEYLQAVLRHHPDFESLFIADAKGRIVAATRAESPEPDWSPGVASDREAALTTLRRSPALGHPTLLVIQSIAARSNNPSAWLFARIDVRAIEALLSRRGRDTEPEFWLFDPQGGLLAERGRLVANPEVRTLPALAADIGAVPAGTLTGLGPALYAARALQGPLEGRLLAGVPSSTAYRPLVDSRRRLWIGGGAVMLGVLGINLLAARGLSRSLRRLAEGARQMSGGNLDVSLPVTGHDEVADLTRSFNDMAWRVRESRDALRTANDDLRAANGALETLAITDGLTGLYNHRHFYDTLARELQRASRELRPLSILLVDLDHFKQYNDRHGHPEGDAALRRVGQQIREAVRESDVVFRYGGEEMAVVLPDCSPEQVAAVAEKVRAAVEDIGHADRAPITVSIGAAAYANDGARSEDLVAAADAALYEAKRGGRNRVVRREVTLAGGRTAAPGPPASDEIPPGAPGI